MRASGAARGSHAESRHALPLARLGGATVEWAVIALLSLAPFLWRKAVGADHIPAADSWAYERIFASFHFDHTIRLVDWNDINLLGMLPVAEIWTTVFGYGRDQLHLLGSFMAGVALLGFRNVLRTLRVPRRLVALTLLGTYSGFVGVAGTFQSDTFAVAGAIWAVALSLQLWARAQEPARSGAEQAGIRVGTRAGWLALLRSEPVLGGGAAVAAFYGFSVRQQAGTSAAVALLVLWACRARFRVAWKVFAIVFVTLAAPFYLWRSGVPNGGAVEIGFHPRSILAAGQWNAVSLGLLIALGVAWLVTRPALRGGLLVVCVALGTGLLAAGHVTRQRAPQERGFMTEMWHHFGEWRSAAPLLVAFAFAAWGSVWVAQGWWAERTTPPTLSASALLARALAICLAGELLVVLTSTYFSRYSLFSGMIALTWIFLTPVAARASTLVLTALVAGLSYWELDQTITANDGTARAGEIVQCLGFPPESLDAGFFWDGMHYDGIAASRGDEQADDGLPHTIDQLYFPDTRRMAVLLPSAPEPTPDIPLSDLEVVGPIRSAGLLPWNEHDYWLVVRATDVDTADLQRCAAGPG